jgi:putative Mg2+ transporter-C (MgtC) family protein
MNALDLESLWRLLLALGCGMCLGLNRDLHHKPAGVRTFSLVSVGSALVTLSAAQLMPADGSAVGRIVQGVLTGIGFVGAGVIFHGERGRGVAGLTTAAAIWFTAVLGIGCGLGHYALVIMGLAVSLAILVVGRPIERLAEHLTGRTSPAGAEEPGADGPGALPP